MFFSPMIKELQEDVPKTVDLVNKMVNQSKNKYVLQYTVEIFLYIKLRKIIFMQKMVVHYDFDMVRF